MRRSHFAARNVLARRCCCNAANRVVNTTIPDDSRISSATCLRARFWDGDTVKRTGVPPFGNEIPEDFDGGDDESRWRTAESDFDRANRLENYPTNTPPENAAS